MLHVYCTGNTTANKVQWDLNFFFAFTFPFKTAEQLFKQVFNKMQCMKRENQQDAAIRCLLLTSVSICFGHHYAHLQESKNPLLHLVYCSGSAGCGW